MVSQEIQDPLDISGIPGLPEIQVIQDLREILEILEIPVIQEIRDISVSIIFLQGSTIVNTNFDVYIPANTPKDPLITNNYSYSDGINSNVSGSQVNINKTGKYYISASFHGFVDTFDIMGIDDIFNRFEILINSSTVTGFSSQNTYSAVPGVVLNRFINHHTIQGIILLNTGDIITTNYTITTSFIPGDSITQTYVCLNVIG